MGTQTQLREGTGSYWMTLGAATIQYPSDGQGGVTATEASSLTYRAGAGDPVIIEAIQLDNCSVAATVNIRNSGSTSTLLSILVPTSATTQYFLVGGAYGLRVNQNFGITYSGTVASIKVFFRYGGV